MFFTVIFIENKYIYSNLEVDFIFFCFLCKKYIQSSFYKCPFCLFSIKSHCWLGLAIESKILSAKSLTLLQDSFMNILAGVTLTTKKAMLTMAFPTSTILDPTPP